MPNTALAESTDTVLNTRAHGRSSDPSEKLPPASVVVEADEHLVAALITRNVRRELAAAPPLGEKLLYSREDAAYALSISVRSVDYLIANQVLRTRAFGKLRLIPAADVRKVADRILRCDMLEGAKTPATPKPRKLAVVRTDPEPAA